jgi:hypothetical protein
MNRALSTFICLNATLSSMGFAEQYDVKSLNRFGNERNYEQLPKFSRTLGALKRQVGTKISEDELEKPWEPGDEDPTAWENPDEQAPESPQLTPVMELNAEEEAKAVDLYREPIQREESFEASPTMEDRLNKLEGNSDSPKGLLWGDAPEKEKTKEVRKPVYTPGNTPLGKSKIDVPKLKATQKQHIKKEVADQAESKNNPDVAEDLKKETVSVAEEKPSLVSEKTAPAEKPAQATENKKGSRRHKEKEQKGFKWPAKILKLVTPAKKEEAAPVVQEQTSGKELKVELKPMSSTRADGVISVKSAPQDVETAVTSAPKVQTTVKSTAQKSKPVPQEPKALPSEPQVEVSSPASVKMTSDKSPQASESKSVVEEVQGDVVRDVVEKVTTQKEHPKKKAAVKVVSSKPKIKEGHTVKVQHENMTTGGSAEIVVKAPAAPESNKEEKAEKTHLMDSIKNAIIRERRTLKRRREKKQNEASGAGLREVLKGSVEPKE